MMATSSTSEAAVAAQAESETDLRRGPWTVEEDLVLVNYIAVHGEGRWNSLARYAGLKRSGKSCRLRWLNYLRPDVRRGNITPEEQLLILQLHSRWGNRWSKIAQHLPGRTDNEIKNYWRTRVQKHAKQLKCDVNSQQFKDAVRRLWIPHLMEKIQANSASSAAVSAAAYSTATSAGTTAACPLYVVPAMTAEPMHLSTDAGAARVSVSPDHSSTAGTSSDSSAETWLSPNLTDGYVAHRGSSSDYGDEFPVEGQLEITDMGGHSVSLLSPCGYLGQGFPDFEQSGWGLAGGGFSSEESTWAADDIWLLQQQL